MSSVLRILSIEDSELDFQLIQQRLTESHLTFEIQRVETGDQLRASLDRSSPDVILSDFSLPAFDGMQALTIAKELAPAVPFILVTGSVNEQTAVDCLKAGADDYVLKDHLRRLPLAIHDAIERRKRETELQDNEERLRLALQSANQGLYDLNIQTGDAIVSPEYARMLEYDPEEFKETNAWWRERLHPDDREPVYRVYEEYVAGKRSEYKVEFRQKTKSGGWKWILSLGKIVTWDQQGRPVRMLGTHTDISERKMAEARTFQLSAAIEHAADAIFMTDRQGNITYVNPAFERLYGYKEEEVLGRNPRILKSGKLSESYYRQFWERILAGESVVSEHVNRKKDGSLVIVEASVNSFLSEFDGLEGFIAVQKDITEKRQAEEERKNLEQQLLQVQKMESIGTLASGIAHDFNNILGIILGYLSLIQRSAGDEKAVKSHIQIVERAVQRGAGLVRQILTFARKTDVNLCPIDINSEIDELVKLLDETFPKTISVVKRLDRKLPVVMMDKNQLHQGLLNLCVNARDAMGSSGTLTLETKCVSGLAIKAQFPGADGRQFVCIRVTDTGMGMTREVQRRIFDPFFTTKEKGKGTGLGLAVVFGIVEGHKGFIDVDSEPGAGTSFSLFVPFSEETSLPVENVVSRDLRQYGGNETILIVEDEESLREMLKGSLESLGYRVLEANDGRAALDLFREKTGEIDLVVSDFGLPKLDGLEAISQMRKISSSLRTILVSGFVEPKERMRMASENIRAFVQKPYAPVDIVSAVRKVLDHR